MQEQRTTTQLPTVPRSIVRKAKHTTTTNIGSPQQWTTSVAVQQQQTTIPTNHIEERTVMSNLSPGDSAKTMMTNVSRMVETLGTVVNTLAKENANMARETAKTNDTIKQMMIQQNECLHDANDKK
jgi:phosphomevalonate kinase